MAKNSRFLESLVHDIPMYPFSSTPDGRIVAELHCGRKGAKEFQDRSLAIQERALDQLVELHKGNSMVPASNFKADESRRVFEDIAYEMQHVYAEQERSARGIEALGQMTSEGFGQIHGDLRGIKGPDAPGQSLFQLMSTDEDFFSAMCAYAKGILSKDAEFSFQHHFVTKLKFWSDRAQELENLFNEQFAREGYKMSSELYDAIQFMKYPRRILEYPREDVTKGMAMLTHVANKYQIPSLPNFVAEVDGFFDQYRKAQQTPVPEEMLIQLGKSRLLTPTVQNQVIKHYPEVRDEASLTTVNYSLLDIAKDTRTAIRQRNILGALGATSLKQQHEMIRQGYTAESQRNKGLAYLGKLVSQGNTSNYHLSTIVDNLAVVHGDMVDLEKIVEDFAGLVEEGFDQVNDTLERGFGVIDDRLQSIQIEMVLTRTAVVSKLREIDESILYVGKAITSSLEKTNELLQELVEVARESRQLARESHKNEARQYFEDGSDCLKSADEIDDIESAYKQFCKGIEAHEMTVENHYGAALCAELLAKLTEAKKRYERAIARCKNDKQSLKSQAQEGLGRVEFKMGNLPEAAKQSKEATETDQKNYSAKYNQAKYLALQGFTDEAINVLSALISKKPEWYLKMKSDNTFIGISEHQLSKLFKNLTSGRETGSTKAKALILDDVITLGKKDMATSIIMELIEIRPMELINKKIWLHPGLGEIYNDLQHRIHQYLSRKLDMIISKPCYELTVLLHCLQFDSATILKVFQKGVDQDPRMYKKGTNRKAVLYQQLTSTSAIEQQKIALLLSRINLPNI